MEITMATIKSYTSLEQSKALTKILPIESADAHYWCKDGNDLRLGGGFSIHKDFDIPAWSLLALLSSIRIEHKLHGFYNGNENMVYRLETLYAGNSGIYDNPVDACYEMIIKLHEQKLL